MLTQNLTQEGWGFGWWLAIILAIIFLLVWMLVKMRMPRRRKGSFGQKASLEILKKRYARGEITKEEFENLKKDLM